VHAIGKSAMFNASFSEDLDQARIVTTLVAVAVGA
jgi:hypothetical protein